METQQQFQSEATSTLRSLLRRSYSLDPGWGAWIPVVHGDLRVAGPALNQGDGAGITDARQLDIQFDAESEVLLFDVRMDVPLLWR
jgi:quercetin 2,3-dioxygenase